MNPHRERNHGSIEHRESIKRILQNRNVANRKRALQGKLQKMAVRFTSSFGPDWDAIDAFKGKQKYTSKSKKFESTGNELKLNGHIVARHHKDGIEVSNAGHDTNKTYSTIKGLGIHARNQKGITKLNNKVIDVNSGEFVLVPHKEISGKPITYTKPTSRKSRSVSKQSIFRDLVEKNEAAAQGRKGKLPLSQINIQPEDQKQINKLTGVKSPIGKEILGVEAHHIFSHKKNKGLTSNPNNGIMIPKADHKLLTSFAKLQSRLQKMAALNTDILGNNDMEEKVGSYDWNTLEELTIEQIHAKGDGRDVFAVAVTKDLDKNSDFREPEKYIDNDFKVKKLGLVKGIYINKKGMKEHDRTYLFHGSEDEVQEQLNLHDNVNKGVAQEEAGKIYKDTDGIVKYDSIPNKKFK